MKFSEFCQKNAVAVALLAAIVALGFITCNYFFPAEKTVYAGNSSGPRHRFFERYRMPRRSEAYVAKYRELVSLLAAQAKLAEEGHKAGNVSIGKLLADRRDLALAQVELLRLEGGHRFSLGAVEALVNLKFAEQIEQQDKQMHQAGSLGLDGYNRSRIALAEAELKVMENQRFLRRNEAYAKLAAEFAADKCNVDTLNALIEAETTWPEHRRGPEGAPQPEEKTAEEAPAVQK
ncbi:MAG: hypothetical protein HPZ91_10510 [Lentisphaeria bacterium]|nr:hypothetical protein [Lentisphaeria bacterium]